MSVKSRGNDATRTDLRYAVRLVDSEKRNLDVGHHVHEALVVEAECNSVAV